MHLRGFVPNISCSFFLAVSRIMCDLSFLTRDRARTSCIGRWILFYFCILAALGFHYCIRFSLVVVSGGSSLVVVHMLLTAVGFPVAKHRL